MEQYSREDLSEAARKLQRRLNIRLPEQTVREYSLGLHPNLLRDGHPSGLSAFERYLVGAWSYCHQPVHYYDIFSAGRSTSLLTKLSKAIEILDTRKVPGRDTRISRLASATSYEDFESTLFELVVAAQYRAQPGVKQVEFIEELPQKKTPDLSIDWGPRQTCCECKKLQRYPDHWLRRERAVAISSSEIMDEFRKKSISAVIELEFKVDPIDTKIAELPTRCFDALQRQRSLEFDEIRITVKHLGQHAPSPNFQLCPSSDFFWNRYGYRVRGPWLGIDHRIDCSWTDELLPANCPKFGPSSWLEPDSIRWDCAVKWAIIDPNTMTKYRRFGFDRIYQGFRQCETWGGDSTVHLWLDSEHFLGGRVETFNSLAERLKQNNELSYNWLVINELLHDVSPLGLFDCVEHAHYLSGKFANTDKPPVTNVFSGTIAGTRTFGKGVELPDIDDFHN